MDEKASPNADDRAANASRQDQAGPLGADRTAQRAGRHPAEAPDYDALVAATSASERRAIETAAKTAAALGSVASWIERAQQQLKETTQAAARSHEEAASLVHEAVGALDQRLVAVERRSGGEQASFGDALKAIERIESRLSAAPPALSAQPAAPAGFEAALESFENRIGALTDRISSLPRPIGRRGLKAEEEVRGAVEEIRSHQLELDRGPAQRSERPSLPALGTLARSQTAILTTLRADIARLTSRMEEPKPAAAPMGAVPAGEVQTEIRTLRESMSGIVTRQDLERLETGIRSLTTDIADLRRAGERAASLPDVQALQAEVRRLADQRGAGDPGTIGRDLEILSHKLDIVAASGVDPDTVGSLARQVEEVRQLLTSAAAPQALSLVSSHLADLRRELADVGGRQVDVREFAALKATVDDVSASVASLRAEPAGRSDALGAMRDANAPMEDMLAALIEKLDRVERRVSDPDALDHLERQIQHLATRIGEGPVGDGGLSALEGSMGELLSQIASWREGAIEAAEHAARTAVIETIEAMPVAAEVERHLNEMSDRYLAAEERTRLSLNSVHDTLEDVMARIAHLEDRPAAANRPVPPSPPAAFERLGDHDLPPPPAPPPVPAIRPASTMPAELPPGPEDEVLLEPGASRPGVPVRPSGAEPPPPPPSADVKSSFIAAARRAAQAAAAETAQPRRDRSEAPSGSRFSGLSPAEILKRVRRMIDEKRRPLLLSAAALVLAIGSVQIVRNAMESPSPAAPAKVATAAAPAPRPAAAPAAAPAQPALAAPSAPPATAAPVPVPAPVAVAAATQLPDPTTTNGIGPKSGARADETSRPAAPAAEPSRTMAAAPGPAPALAAPPSAAIPLPPTLSVAARAALAPDPATSLPAGLRQAAAAGDVIAMYELASRSADGRGVARDVKAAAALFEKAAEKGSAPAQYRIGNMYERGVGVSRDIEAARNWYRRAAEAGNVRAMHNLAVLSADGSAARRDYAAAIQWFTKAAEHGVRDSQFNLAVLYARGLGTGQDLSRSYHWLAVAAGSGDDDAAKKRDEVGGRLSAADLARAKAGVERWRPSAANPAANEVAIPVAGWPETPARRASRDTRA